MEAFLLSHLQADSVRMLFGDSIQDAMESRWFAFRGHDL